MCWKHWKICHCLVGLGTFEDIACGVERIHEDVVSLELGGVDGYQPVNPVAMDFQSQNETFQNGLLIAV